MAKLYFRHGAMTSAKTLNLLAVAYNYETQGKKVIVMKPNLDNRYAVPIIRSRAGLERPADILLPSDEQEAADQNLLDLKIFSAVSCVLVDEAQFLAVATVEQLRDVATIMNIPVICYGLRTDFRTRLFPASARLMELADSIEEVKTTCSYCNRKAIINMKHTNGIATITGPTIDLGKEEKYAATCYQCFKGQLKRAEALSSQ